MSDDPRAALAKAIADFIKAVNPEYIGDELEMVANEDHVYERIKDMVTDDDLINDIVAEMKK